MEGIGIDVARFCAGEPECWTDVVQHEASGPSRVLRLVVGGFVSCGIDAAVFTRRGAAILSLVELLERAGRRVEVTLTFALATYSSVPELEFRVRLKDAEQPIDVPRLAFAIANPATFRRLCFAAMEGTEGIGVACARAQYSRGGLQCTERGDIYLPQATLGESQWATPASAQAWVLAELQRLGVELRSAA